MRKMTSFLMMLSAMSFMGIAQDDQPRPGGRKLQGLKIAYVSKQLNLSSDEAQKFWPVYDSYTAELKKARQDKKKDVLLSEEEILNIRKKYRSEFKKILNNDDRVNKVLTSDRDFNNMLRKELQQRIQNKNTAPAVNGQ